MILRGQSVSLACAITVVIFAATCGPVAGHSSAHRNDPRSAETGPDGQGHRTVAGILCLMLLAGFARVYRALWHAPQAAHVAIQMAPPGTTAVECGTCRSVQYVPGHGHAFLCFRCHSVNWLPGNSEGLSGDLRAANQPQMPQMPSLAVGPLRRFAFTRRSDTLFEPAPRDDEASEAEGRSAPPTVIGSAAPATEAATPRSRAGFAPCQICMDAPSDALLMPCAHGGLCRACATKIAQNASSGGAVCPHCRSEITMVVKIDEIDGEKVQGTELRIPIARPVADPAPTVNQRLFPWQQSQDRIEFPFFERRLRAGV